MKTADFKYELPERLIAQHPVEPRDSCRMMVYHRTTRQTEHRHFYDLPEYLRRGDVLVVNNTKVIPARLYGQKENTGGKIEFLLLKRLSLKTWEVILKPGRSAKEGAVFHFGNRLKATIRKVCETGNRIAEFDYDGVFEEILNEIGQMPLPHYIKEKLSDPEKYNTVYSKTNGSAAAPTAGLHFTTELLDRLKMHGVEIVEVLLHVGLGTFRPVKVDDVTKHEMHSEYYEMSPQAAQRINLAKREGRRVIAVGTTSVRVLESVANPDGSVRAESGETKIFIYPGYRFRTVDALITNFHLPESTLIMLVSAFCSKEEVLELYRTAVEDEYRFFSFGDSMLIL